MSEIVGTSEWAADVTKRIRKAGEDFGALLLEAHEGEAWRQLGYGSWSAYVDAEFEFSRRHSYRLLTQGRVNKQLADAGSGVRVSEREARETVTHGSHIEVERTVQARRAEPRKQRSKYPPGQAGKLQRLYDLSRSFFEELEGVEFSEYPVPREYERAIDRMADGWTELRDRIIAASNVSPMHDRTG